MRTFSSITMKNITKFALVSFAVLSASFAYADGDGPPLPDCSNYTHCTHVQGLSSNNNEGRYVKLTSPTLSETLCISDNFSLMPTPFFVYLKHLKAGDVSLTMSICKDAGGVECANFGTDNYSYANADRPVGSSSPKITNVVVSADLVAAMPSCVAKSPYL